ncbi:hypothetical protein QV06_02080 [Gallibacterium genomosp. 3]|uniref:Iron ABC transporter n=1 Tax=Gallibacterium genomosp. 3 TaxID=505345 RepID=A0A1A7PWA4_9PAST|nr:Fe(3+)-hydroxamate ABC transporter permease FhuB [Gallibacterium genomosp. 3]OBX05435.1 hypothetical protein QV06_02080 [Gallibacterium genomosp. 3]
MVMTSYLNRSLLILAIVLFSVVVSWQWYAIADQAIAQLLLFNFTLPRVVIAILAGISLGSASLLLQQTMSNSLASDSTLAVSGGAQFALYLATLFFPALLQFGTTIIAVIGALLTLGLVLLLAWRQLGSPLLIVLSGLVLSFYVGAFSALLTLFYPEESRGLLVWGSGSLVQESWRASLTLLPLLVPGLIGIYLLSPALQVLQLQEGSAKSLGVNVTRVRLLAIILAAYLVAIVVSRVGMLAFIGLAATTLARQSANHRFTSLWWRSAFFAAILLLITDLSLQLINQWWQIQLPTGSVTALFGTPLLLWLVFRQRQHYGRAQQPANRLVIRNSRLTYLLLTILLLCSLVCAFCVGQNQIGWSFTLNHSLFELRFPRIAYAFAAGTLLALAGVVLQRLSHNPMASPELLGITSGVSFGVLLEIFIVGSVAIKPFLLFGALGAVLIIGLIWLINQRNGLQPEQVLLTGISLSAIFDAVLRILVASGDPRALQLLNWGAGSTYYAELPVAVWVIIFSFGLLLVSLIFSRWLDLLSLNAIVAQAVGMNLLLAKIVLFALAIVLTLLATLIVGTLSFIGLLAPHLAYSLGFNTAKSQLIAASLLGATVMIFADWLGRQWLFPYEIPAGLVATLLGGSYFIILMRKL